MVSVQRSAGIGIDDDHEALRRTVRGWALRHRPIECARALLDVDVAEVPPWWDSMVEQGWLGLHVPEADGGSGFGMLATAVVLEELGRACTPGPLLPTVLASAAITRFGVGAVRALLPALATGARCGAVAIGAAPVACVSDGEGVRVSGTWRPVLGAELADVLVLPVALDGVRDVVRWLVVDAEACSIATDPSVDRTRRTGTVELIHATVPAWRLLDAPSGAAGVAGLAAVLAGAEAVGSAAWSVDAAAEHARVREQFGRPIGQFQAVKHRCADMLCTLEAARAVVWAAATALDEVEPSAPLAAAVAGAKGIEASYANAKGLVQVLGGIGFTWEHDAHLHLKRAIAGRALLGTPAPWHRSVVEQVLAGQRWTPRVELPAEAAAQRDEVRAFLDDLRAGARADWNRRVADAGYLVPHWPRPWGRDATPAEQLVIDEEFRAARVRRPHLAVGAWALPTIIAHGTPEQQQRFILPTLRGEVVWCQMFSEPGAGSDLASLSTRATRVPGGWSLTGQKVWTSMAHIAQWGICLARTDPDAPKHDGIGCFLVDMASAGLDIRPLRELTGAEMFNEVFLDEVFVPDDCVVGAPTEDWHAARTTLGNERVSMGSGSSMGPSVEALVALAEEIGGSDGVADELGAVLATAHTLAALGARMTLRSLAGAAPGSDASVRKLLGVEHDQRTQELALELLGPAVASGGATTAAWVGGFLGNRSLSIAGGTSEIQRNVIAERLLDLPRD